MLEYQDKWDVKFYNWQKFSNAVVDQSGALWSHFQDADLLIGGVNFTNNFLWVLLFKLIK